MKLSTRDARAFFGRPDTSKAGVLIHGAEQTRVRLHAKDLLAALLGAGAEEEMRLTRLQAADLRKDPAALQDAMRAGGFFPGARAVWVEEASDGLTETCASALDAWAEGDATLVLTANALPARSKLRKLFEGGSKAVSAAIYDDPPDRAEIEALAAQAGLPDLSRDALEAFQALAIALDPSELRQTIEKAGLFKRGDDSPLTPEEITLMAPGTIDGGVDDLLNIAAEGRTGEIGPMMRRIEGQGVQPVFLCIQAGRHFRALLVAASDPGGPGSGIGKLRPPVFGPRRDRMLRQVQGWGAAKLEQALHLILETDLALRSGGQTAPAFALTERLMIRLSVLGSNRR
ncbi:MAG: DNA polymerase III subunit delta [Pseudomonadota bacterium]